VVGTLCGRFLAPRLPMGCRDDQCTRLQVLIATRIGATVSGSPKRFDRLLSGRSTAFIIMEGCSKYCSTSFLYARGEEGGRPLIDVLAEYIHRTACAEITLLGQNVNSYRVRPTAAPADRYDE
jgi:tRNA A37 methylthiotransferase MiaB